MKQFNTPQRMPSRPVRILLGAATVFLVLAVFVAHGFGGSSRAAEATATAPSAAKVTTSATSGAVGGSPTAVQPTAAADPQEGAIALPDEAISSAAVAANASGPTGRFQMPLRAWSKVTDRYGAARGGGLVHGGIDLALDGLHHSNVYAACTGSVDSTGYSGTYGNHVIVDCGDSFTTLYAHLSSVLVRTGDHVDNTVAVGVSGSTGFSTGEHLHFEVRYKGAPVNPEHYLDFHIAPGTPLSDGPIYFGGSGGSGATPSPTDAPPEPTATSTPTPPPTATPTFTPTATPTFTPTATPTPKTPRKTATPPPVLQN